MVELKTKKSHVSGRKQKTQSKRSSTTSCNFLWGCSRQPESADPTVKVRNWNLLNFQFGPKWYKGVPLLCYRNIVLALVHTCYWLILTIIFYFINYLMLINYWCKKSNCRDSNRYVMYKYLLFYLILISTIVINILFQLLFGGG